METLDAEAVSPRGDQRCSRPRRAAAYKHNEAPVLRLLVLFPARAQLGGYPDICNPSV